MTEIIGVRFKGNGKEYYFNPNGVAVAPGQHVVVETSRGMEIGECVTGNRKVDEMTLIAPLRPMQRIATAEDLRVVEQNREKEKKAFAICEEKIAQHGLDMKLVEVEYSFEGNKILFFFTSDDRVDFRALVKDLAGTLHARIELRQIGVRDEAKLLGGLGVCGRPFCCSTCLGDFQPVSIKMAKIQGLSLNPTKISGTCGRLMCCLKYEQEAYEDLVRRVPRADSFVETPDGAGTISSVNLLREQAKVRLDSAPESPKTYRASELRVIRSGKGRRPEDYVEPPLEELEKLRYIPPEEERIRELAAEKNDLSAKLESVFAATQATEQRQKNKDSAQPSQSGGGRRRESGGKEPKEAAERQEGSGSRRRQNNRNKGQKPAQKQQEAAAPKATQEQGQSTEKTSGGEGKKKNSSRRWRRRPKKSAGQGGGNPQSQS